MYWNIAFVPIGYEWEGATKMLVDRSSFEGECFLQVPAWCQSNEPKHTLEPVRFLHLWLVTISLVVS